MRSGINYAINLKRLNRLFNTYEVQWFNIFLNLYFRLIHIFFYYLYFWTMRYLNLICFSLSFYWNEFYNHLLIFHISVNNYLLPSIHFSLPNVRQLYNTINWVQISDYLRKFRRLGALNYLYNTFTYYHIK